MNEVRSASALLRAPSIWRSSSAADRQLSYYPRLPTPARYFAPPQAYYNAAAFGSVRRDQPTTNRGFYYQLRQSAMTARMATSPQPVTRRQLLAVPVTQIAGPISTTRPTSVSRLHVDGAPDSIFYPPVVNRREIGTSASDLANRVLQASPPTVPPAEPHSSQFDAVRFEQYLADSNRHVQIGVR